LRKNNKIKNNNSKNCCVKSAEKIHSHIICIIQIIYNNLVDFCAPNNGEESKLLYGFCRGERVKERQRIGRIGIMKGRKGEK
jgi:hypothetical protein